MDTKNSGASSVGRKQHPVSVTATQVVQAALREDIEIAELVEYANADPAFALRILSFVNSPLVGLSKRVNDLKQASNFLGVRGLRNLALSLLVTSLEVGTSPESALLLANCLRRAVLARELAKASGRADVDVLFTTGLLLDVGLLLAARDDSALAIEVASSPAAWRVTCERAAGLVPHPIRGASLAREYGLSTIIVDALEHHHDRTPPSEPASSIAWLAERCAAVFEGGDSESHRRLVVSSAIDLGIGEDVVDSILASVPSHVVELARVFDREIGPQLDIAELTARAQAELSNLNAKYGALVHSLETTLSEKEKLESELRAANARLERLASIDELTGVLNRRALEEALRRDLARADRDCKALSILLIDVDHFKNVNDTWGHQSGDEVLTLVGETLRRGLRISDVAGRYGGEEFVCILPATDTGGARIVAERLRLAVLEHTVPAAGSFIQISVSIGIATVHGPGCRTAFEDLVRTADANLYRAKSEGRNRVVG